MTLKLLIQTSMLYFFKSKYCLLLNDVYAIDVFLYHNFSCPKSSSFVFSELLLPPKCLAQFSKSRYLTKITSYRDVILGINLLIVAKD